MRQPTKPKPQAFEEVARVLNVFLMLRDELLVRPLPEGVAPLPKGVIAVSGDAILAVAERIAARTEG